MPKILKLKNEDKKTGKLKNVGSIEIKNQTEEKAELYFYGDIVSSSWESYWYEEDKCPQDITDFLKELESSKSIDIFINSGGGSVHGGLAIYNLLKRHKGQKTVYVDGIAASIASVIAMAGDKIIIPSNAQFMIHKPLTWCGGNANDFRKTADILDTCQKSITNIYMENVKEGITEEKITELINNETWFTGNEVEQYFNVKVEEQSDVVACSSQYFSKYSKTPSNILNKEKGSIDHDEIAAKVIQIIKNKNLDAKEKELKDKLEKEKEEILNDLDLI
ncbi:head maturation protease, ClpP-related [Romboutsia hominis]|uniref:head maturation protease, ClpP-related n=1 Tax=Romboutsia hominis TaxID=1507512 RepID=UPI000AF72A0F|nr:head maturation protease, ClpP-related [Romboutsia hominis]